MSRAIAAALLVLALAACGRQDDRAPFLQSRTPPDLAERFYPPQGWAWGLVAVGKSPAHRYGVASPPVAPRAHVLIVTGQGESAEAWFETAQDLMARGITVWVIERAGQAGSGRYAGPRDLIHAPSFEPDAAAVRAMVELVIRAEAGEPVVILAQGDGAVVAMRAVETGTRVDGLILSSPRFSQGKAGRAESLLVRAGLGRLPTSGRKGWSRDHAARAAKGLTHDLWRGRVQQAWELANPDLRMLGESLGWRAAFASASRTALQGAGGLGLPVLVLAPEGGPARQVCDAAPECSLRLIAGAAPALNLESDRFRDPWLEQVAGFVAARIGPRAAPLSPRPEDGGG